MEKTLILNRSISRWRIGILAIAVIVAAWIGYRIHKEHTMPKPLVFLIPEDYIGPVFMFLDQEDGVDLQSDPLGNSVTVPKNGVVKAKFDRKSIPYGDPSPNFRPRYYVSVSKTGDRRIMTVSGGTVRDDDGDLADFYLDPRSNINSYKLSDDPETEQHPFYYFSELKRNERMIFNKGTCSDQGFSPDAEKALGVEKTISMQEAGIPPCEKFLAVSPNELLDLPGWMWGDIQRPYQSVEDFSDEADIRMKNKEVYYK